MLKQVPLELINSFSKNTLLERIGLEFIELGDDYLKARMPVDDRTRQPMGWLHGGASVALIESLGSVGSNLLIDITKEAPIGLEVNANHVGSAQEGYVVATGKIAHAGKRTHVWHVEIHEEGTSRLICTGRLTVMIIEKK